MLWHCSSKVFVFCSRKWWQFILVSHVDISPNCHNLTGFQYDWTPAFETHRKPQPEPSDWPTYNAEAVIVAPCTVMRTLSLALFDWRVRFSSAAVSQKQKWTPCSPTDTHPASTPIVSVYTLHASMQLHVLTICSQPTILTTCVYMCVPSFLPTSHYVRFQDLVTSYCTVCVQYADLCPLIWDLKCLFRQRNNHYACVTANSFDQMLWLQMFYYHSLDFDSLDQTW